MGKLSKADLKVQKEVRAMLHLSTGNIIHELRFLRDIHRRIDVVLENAYSLKMWNRGIAKKILSIRSKPLSGARSRNELVWYLLALQRVKMALVEPAFLFHWRAWVLHHISVLEEDHDRAMKRLREKERKRRGF